MCLWKVSAGISIPNWTMQREQGLMLYETMCGGRRSLQQPGDDWEEPEPEPEDVLERYSLIFKAEEGSLSVPCSALKGTVQYPGEVFSLGRCSRSLPVCVFQMGALWISSVFAFSEKFSYDFPLRILQQMQFLCRFPLSSPQALCALF